MAQSVMDVMPHQPLMVWVSNFGNKPVHMPKRTVLGIASPLPAHNMNFDSAFSGVAEVKKRERLEVRESLVRIAQKRGRLKPVSV